MENNYFCTRRRPSLARRRRKRCVRARIVMMRHPSPPDPERARDGGTDDDERRPTRGRTRVVRVVVVFVARPRRLAVVAVPESTRGGRRDDHDAWGATRLLG